MKLENFKKIGKAIVIEGTKIVTLTAGTHILMKVSQEGIEGVKRMTLDDLIKTK